ncbi:hypothetical protein JI435_058850 [Parastagonospora nodorum SN15]|uniref:DUF7082 domain-containing protein n=1 Tax=Phaeosphaeria nodorum (strain SN15 / ATCC MYA-4574 / FGSC 10173) TaxID=321614 RepID=A0A7U2I9A4_PHANO|nr:hypothetical protein JI435_058850 [Parastagonospora nodorum SN15]
MSGYDKNQQYVYEAEATRSNQLPSYTGIAQPTLVSQYTGAPAELGHGLPRADMSYVPTSTYESRATAALQPDSSFIDAGSRHPASLTTTETVISEYVTPSHGTARSTVSVQISSDYDLASSANTFILMFGTKKCVAALQKVDYDDDAHNYLLNVEVPPYPLTNAWNPTMMLKLQIEDKNGNLLSQCDAGKFTFTDMSPNLAYQSSPEYSRKRRYSPEFDDTQDYTDNNPAKRVAPMRYHAKPRTMSGAYSEAQISPLPAQSSLSNTYSGAYNMSKQTSYASQLSQKGFAVPSGAGLTHTDFKLPQMSPSLPSYGHYSTVTHTSRNSASMAGPQSGASGYATSGALQTPVLVRATSISQTGGAATSQPFNPYSMYQSKAILKVDGDLDKMSEDWTQEELDAKRRLVEFKRSQHGSTITTSFAPVTPEARATRSICVSCIWWEEKDECFITSVDTIFLLEQLVNVRFTVEEKNRIRRNLEGFRPMTVSKAKLDSEAFFKVIMGFPNPKPRNIEKDVKVFSWKVLAQALKKIISKYSASYSSTAGVGSLPITSTSTYPGAMSHAAASVHRNSSPQSVSASTASTAYTPHLAASSLSPHLRVSAGLEGSAGHGMSVPQRTPSGHSMTQWGASAHQMQYPTSLTQGGRNSWDYPYLSAAGAVGMPSAAQSLQRTDLAGDISQITADNTYHPYGERTTRV